MTMLDPSGDEHRAVERELLDAAEKWANAMLSNDADRIGSFMADEWVMVSDRGISSKEHFLSFVRSGALTHSSFAQTGPPARVRIYGDAAVVSSRIVNTAHFNGQRFEADEWTTDVMVRRDGKWQCVLSQITSADRDFEEMIRQRRDEAAAE